MGKFCISMQHVKLTVRKPLPDYLPHKVLSEDQVSGRLAREYCKDTCPTPNLELLRLSLSYGFGEVELAATAIRSFI